MGEVILIIDDEFETGYEVLRCRICHEQEFESSLPLEAPCSCSGTIKFAHRDCIQRWCNEKGSTICEICLQNYEPGYIAPSKKLQKPDPRVTIRESLEIPRNEVEPASPTSPPTDGGVSVSTHYTACTTTTTAPTTSCWCRSLALTFTLVLLVRHFYDVLAFGTADYPFTIATVLILRASGIIFPMYILIRTITAIQNSIRRHRYRDSDDEISSFEDDDDGRQHHVV